MLRLKELRTHKGISQQAVAEYLGITQQAYANYEREAREADYQTLKKISEFFGVSIDYILYNYELDDIADCITLLTRGQTLQFLMNIRKINSVQLAELTNIPAPRITNIKFGQCEMTDREISIFSKALNVPELVIKRRTIPKSVYMDGFDYPNTLSLLNSLGKKKTEDYISDLAANPIYTDQTKPKTLGKDITEEMSKNVKGAHINTK